MAVKGTFYSSTFFFQQKMKRKLFQEKMENIAKIAKNC